MITRVSQSQSTKPFWNDEAGEVYAVRVDWWEKDRYVLIRAPSALQAAQRVHTGNGSEVSVFSFNLLTRYSVDVRPVLTERP